MPDMKDPDCASSSRRRFLANVGLMTSWAAVAPRPVLGLSTQADNGAPKLQAFDLRDVDLAEGPFLHAQRMTEAYLLKLEPDRMLHNFRVNAGLKPRPHSRSLSLCVRARVSLDQRQAVQATRRVHRQRACRLPAGRA
jgi:hypothetical protein